MIQSAEIPVQINTLYVKGHLKHMLKFEHLLKAPSSIPPKVKAHFSVSEFRSTWGGSTAFSDLQPAKRFHSSTFLDSVHNETETALHSATCYFSMPFQLKLPTQGSTGDWFSYGPGHSSWRTTDRASSKQHIIPSHDAASPLLSSKQSFPLSLPKSISKILPYLLYNLFSLSITSLYFAFRN